MLWFIYFILVVFICRRCVRTCLSGPRNSQWHRTRIRPPRRSSWMSAGSPTLPAWTSFQQRSRPAGPPVGCHPRPFVQSCPAAFENGKPAGKQRAEKSEEKKNHLLKTFDFPFICFNLCFIGDQHTNNCLWILQTSRKLHFARAKYAAGDPIKMKFVPWDLGKHLSKMAHITFSFLFHMFPFLSYTTYAAYLCVLKCPWLLLSPSGPAQCVWQTECNKCKEIICQLWLQSLPHQSACKKKICCLSATPLFLAVQIVYNGLITAQASENHFSLKRGGENSRRNTRTQVNGNQSWRCHGKMFVMLSRLSAIWLETTQEKEGRKNKTQWPVDQRGVQKKHGKKHAAVWMTKCLLCVQVPDTEHIFSPNE